MRQGGSVGSEDQRAWLRRAAAACLWTDAVSVLCLLGPLACKMEVRTVPVPQV